MRVKICGITSVDDALAAANAGADAIGLVFYEHSPRYVSEQIAKQVALAVGPFVTVTGLFVNESHDKLIKILSQVPLQLLQFHGDERPEYCEQFSRPYIKAIRMREGVNVSQTINRFSSATGILLDAYRPGIPGGTGEVFDWQRVPQQASKPIILAGGLTPDNVDTAIAQTTCYGVDVSGGVELSPGIKDHQKIKDFIALAKR
ncbi:MAG: phosphoribosylanthranilate isomerase [Pseudomonadota bacterium]